MAHLTRQEEVLVALFALPTGEATPVQAIKMLFLIEKQAANSMGGPNFNFIPYDYGPFDQGVYVELEALARQGLVEIVERRPRIYRLTERGRPEADRLTRSLDQDVAALFSRIGGWMSKLRFSQLVTAIYAACPQMRANSIFRG